MDSDTNLDGEVDYSFFDSDCEGGRRSSRTDTDRGPSSADASYPGSGGEGSGSSRRQGECGQGAAGQCNEDASESRGRPGSSASSASPHASLSSASPASVSPSPPVSESPSPPSSSSSSSSGKEVSFPGEAWAKSTEPPNNSGDNAGSSDEGTGEIGSRPQSGPSARRSSRSRSGEAAPSDPASNSDSDTNNPSSDRSSSSSSGKRSPSLPTSQRRPRSSPNSRKGPIKGQGKNEDEDSEGTVTDVTPLTSPDSSPIYRCKESKAKSCRKKSSNKQENISQEVYSSLDRLSFDREKGQGRQKSRRQRQPRDAKSCNVSSKSDSLEPKRLDQRHRQKILNDATDLNQLLKAMMHLEKRELRKIVADFPPRRHRKNYTFSNEETKRIDCENQRLLQELTRKATKPTVVTPKKISPATVRIYHSTLNRQREQARIERENLAFLKRLEAVQPTVGLKRSTQLLEYQRQMSFTESYSQRSRPTTTGSMSRISSRSSSHKNIHPASNSSA